MMPTGYTHAVDDGSMTEFRDFALVCARAFGALIDMRDDSLDAPLPQEIKPRTSFDDEGLAEARSKLASLSTMSTLDIENAHEAAAKYYWKTKEEYLTDQQARRQRHLAMIAKVGAWAPPTPNHEEMKRFMLQQLDISMPSASDRYYGDAPASDAHEWHKAQMDKCVHDIDYHLKKISEEIARAKERDGWLRALVKSLDSPPSEDEAAHPARLEGHAEREER